MHPEIDKITLEVLNRPEMWDGSYLNYANTRDGLRVWLENLYYVEWYWPKVKHFCRTLKKLHPEWEWDKVDLNGDGQEECDWVYNLDIPEWFECQFWDDIHNTWGEYLEIPDKEYVLGLGFRPPLVWAKENEDGSIQPSMF